MNDVQFADFIADKYDNPDGIHHYEITKIVVAQQDKDLMIIRI